MEGREGKGAFPKAFRAGFWARFRSPPLSPQDAFFWFSIKRTTNGSLGWKRRPLDEYKGHPRIREVDSPLGQTSVWGPEGIGFCLFP